MVHHLRLRETLRLEGDPDKHHVRTQPTPPKQYRTTTCAQTSTPNIQNYLNHTQSKGTIYMRPPLQIANLTLTTQECNPYEDIHTNKLTILVQGPKPCI